MKKNSLYFINIFLSILFLGGLVFNIAIRFKNKEQDKIFWTAEIQSSAEKSLSKNSNIVKIVSAVLHNTFNESSKTLDDESLRETNGILRKKSKNPILFKFKEKELLPDSIYLKYYSVDESKFYLLSIRLPYEKTKKIVEKINANPILLIEIHPKGETVLKVKVNEDENTNSETVETFIAKETSGTLEMLIYEKSLSGEYNGYKGIDNIMDFSDLLKNQYKWFVKIGKGENDKLTSIYAYSFTEEEIEISENIDLIELRHIPSRFYIDWENEDEQHSATYYFSPKEILKFYRKLNAIDPSGQIILLFKIKDRSIQCKISNSKISLPLKNLYP